MAPQKQPKAVGTSPQLTRLPPMTVDDKVEILNLEEYHQDQTLLTVLLYEEDHTVGNALKHVICQMPGVEFCGYNVPHPLEDKILVRIQTEKGYSAGDILCQGLNDLWEIFDSIQRKFTKAHADFERAGKDGTAGQKEEGETERAEQGGGGGEGHSRDEFMEETTTDEGG